MARAPRFMTELRAERFNSEGVDTKTSEEQIRVEESCLPLFLNYWTSVPYDVLTADTMVDSSDEELEPDHSALKLHRIETQKYLRKALFKGIPEGYSCLDASRPWLVYWIAHGLALLGDDHPDEQKREIIDFLKRCQDPAGGFGGGPGQLAHLAPTYAAVNALATLDCEEGFAIIDRQKLAEWISSLRQKDGSFFMHREGEVDIRGAYCAMSVAKLTNIYTPEMFENTDVWLLRCQTYEGGFGGAPGMEAHGGYSFCGLAALTLMNKERLCNLDRLLRWAANRQMRVEGGFQGRTNKLVDGCYSFWQGGIFPLIYQSLAEDGHASTLSPHRWLFDQEALQEYLLICCQDPRGGLFDKPGKPRDYYHTSYTLAGLSVAQHFYHKERENTRITGDEDNLLERTHPLYNVVAKAVHSSLEYFNRLPVPKVEVKNKEKP